MKVYGDIVVSEADGPGERAVVHLAGCSVGCAGCFSPHTHPSEGSRVSSRLVSDVAKELLSYSLGVTISGGEPTDQLPDLIVLLGLLRAGGCDDIVVFTGRTLEWLERKRPLWAVLTEMSLADVVVDGPYVATKHEEDEWMRGSTNQRVTCLTSRWTEDDFRQRVTQIEIVDGRMVVTGFPSAELNRALEQGASQGD